MPSPSNLGQSFLSWYCPHSFLRTVKLAHACIAIRCGHFTIVHFACTGMQQEVICTLQCNNMNSSLLLPVSFTVLYLPHNQQSFPFVLLCKCPFCFVLSFFTIVNLSQCHLLCRLLSVGSPTLSQYCDFFSFAKFHAQIFPTPDRPCGFSLVGVHSNHQPSQEGGSVSSAIIFVE